MAETMRLKAGYEKEWPTSQSPDLDCFFDAPLLQGGPILQTISSAYYLKSNVHAKNAKLVEKLCKHY